MRVKVGDISDPEHLAPRFLLDIAIQVSLAPTCLADDYEALKLLFVRLKN
jgi:hypothetical protein